jgi:hypothetical protein
MEKGFVGTITPLILQFREELYTQPYNEVNWKKVHHMYAKGEFTLIFSSWFILAHCYICFSIYSSNTMIMQNYCYTGGSLLFPSFDTRFALE